MIFPSVSDTFFLPNVDPCHDNSDDKDMAVIVGGGTAFVKTWIEYFTMEGGDEVEGRWRRMVTMQTGTAGLLFAAPVVNSTTREPKQPSMRTIDMLIHCMVLNLSQSLYLMHMILAHYDKHHVLP